MKVGEGWRRHDLALSSEVWKVPLLHPRRETFVVVVVVQFSFSSKGVDSQVESLSFLLCPDYRRGCTE